MFFKFLIAALVIAVLLPFTVLKGKDGRPLMSLGDLKAPDLAIPELPDGDVLKKPLQDAGNKDIVYKWKDDKGEWHFSSTPPPDGVQYTAKGYDPNTNLIQSVPVNREPDISATEPEGKEVVNDQDAGEIGNPYSPEKVEKLFKEAKNVQKLLDDRFKQQEALMGR